MHTELSTTFPDAEIDEIALRHCDDAVLVEGLISGTHLGSFRGLPPAGRTVRYRVAALFLSEDERLVCERVYFDTMEVLRSLGFGLEPGSARAGLALAVSHPLRLFAAVVRRAIRGGSASRSGRDG